MDWFFDYWMRTGTEFPSYRVRSATMRMVPDADEEDATAYHVTAEIENLGTGRMPVAVDLVTAQGSATQRVWIGPKETVMWEMTSRHVPKTVIVDAAGWILMAPYRDEEKREWFTVAQRDVEMIEEE